MVLLQCDSADRLIDEECPGILLCAEVVQPNKTARAQRGRVRYVTMNWWELPQDYVPSGPLDLIPHPNGGVPVLTVFHYSIAKVFDGPVYFFLRVYDPDFDGSPFIGEVFAAEDRGGEGGLEPLFRHLDREEDECKRPVCPIPDYARGISLMELGLSTVLINCLESEGITTVLDLCVRTAKELLEIRNLGKKRLQEVRNKLAATGLWLWDEKSCEDKTNLKPILWPQRLEGQNKSVTDIW